MPKIARTERRRGVRLALTQRDAHLLRVLNRFRLARTGEVAAVVFPDVHVHTVSRRLRRLYDASYLAVTAPDRASENVYAVGPRGRAWLREHGIAPNSAPRGSVRHHLGCVQAWVQVAAAVGRMPNVVLERVAPHWELQEASVPPLLVPDLLCAIALRQPDGATARLQLAVEVDCGTESHTVLVGKCRRYQHALQESTPGEAAALVLGIALSGVGERRKESVVRVLEREGVRAMVWMEQEGPSHALESLIECCSGVLLRDSRRGPASDDAARRRLMSSTGSLGI